MNKAYRLALALLATAASLSSCSRANYAFNPVAPAYLGSQPTRTVAAAPVTPAAGTAAPVVAARPVAVPAIAAAPVVVPATQVPVAAVAPRRPAQVAAAWPAVAAAPAAIATEPAQAAKPSLAQRLVLKKINKQLAKAGVRDQNTAGVAHTAAHSTGLTITIIGLIALLVGIIASSALVITLGSIVLVIGLIVLLLGAL